MTENTTTTIETPAATTATVATHANGKPVGAKKAKLAAHKAAKQGKGKPAKEQVTATKEVKAGTAASTKPDNRPLKADGKGIPDGWVAILKYLAKKEATSRNASISKADAMKGGCPNGGWHEMADCGWAGVEGLGLLARADAEEGKTTYLTERFFLTAAGKAAVKKMLGK